MGTNQKIAIVLGGTGLIGGFLIKRLLDDKRYKTIKLFSRRAIGFEHPKIEEEVIDLLNLETQTERFYADEVFCCIGTTNAKTSDKSRYKEIDYGIPVAAAQLCVANKIETIIVVSALGADSSSRIFYNRIKGLMEDEVLRLKIAKTHLVQPSMIGGDRKEKRLGEYFFKKLMLVFGFLLQGSLKKYRVIHPDTIAITMVWLANNPNNKKRIPSHVLKQIADNATLRN
ncbi:NAD-dependent epimerase/dehydratase family protein [Croceitalea rosinachiae]|uniref:NAD-dependent epimerase/dehydratase family protein n=1 Tax=Croceitalea rosinachiae TaxID=3075596 RepID=A0ABU3A9H5_9FLAO|nr:NAD-dependent epimerase/dehydratase family protein [Croceitalea sp. F388]MDT0606455.1 NAD-dependent epimerase/dehydratase family protein [Croceitalea sp. F388]